MSAIFATTQESRQGLEIRDYMATEVVKGEVGGKKHGQEEVGRLFASRLGPADCARLLVVMKRQSLSMHRAASI